MPNIQNVINNIITGQNETNLDYPNEGIRNIILYGPPGTGKTYVLNQLREYFTAQQATRTQQVQDAMFHYLQVNPPIRGERNSEHYIKVCTLFVLNEMHNRGVREVRNSDIQQDPLFVAFVEYFGREYAQLSNASRVQYVSNVLRNEAQAFFQNHNVGYIYQFQGEEEGVREIDVTINGTRFSFNIIEAIIRNCFDFIYLFC